MKKLDGEAGASGRIEEDIATIRDEIGGLVDELDRRRRELFDVRLQMQRHPVATGIACVTVAALLGGAVAMTIHDVRRRQRASFKAKQLRAAFGRMMDHPERVARGEPPPAEKILAAVGTAVATLLVKRAMERAVPAPSQRAARKDGELRAIH